MNEEFWSDYYKKNNRLTDLPSSFAKFLVEETSYFPNQELSLLDIGCGNARDTFYFLKNGLDSYGVDSCGEVVEKNTIRSLELFKEHEQRFFKLDVNDINFDQRFLIQKFQCIYSRFFIHAIDQKGEDFLLEYLSNAKEKTILAVEFRTDKDKLFLLSQNKENNIAKTDHYRRFVNFNDFCEKILNCGYEIVYSIEKDGLSVFGNDNPTLGRIVAKKK